MGTDAPAIRVLQGKVTTGLAVFVESLSKKKPHQFLCGEGRELLRHENLRKSNNKLFLVNRSCRRKLHEFFVILSQGGKMKLNRFPNIAARFLDGRAIGIASWDLGTIRKVALCQIVLLFDNDIDVMKLHTRLV